MIAGVAVRGKRKPETAADSWAYRRTARRFVRDTGDSMKQLRSGRLSLGCWLRHRRRSRIGRSAPRFVGQRTHLRVRPPPFAMSEWLNHGLFHGLPFSVADWIYMFFSELLRATISNVFRFSSGSLPGRRSDCPECSPGSMDRPDRSPSRSLHTRMKWNPDRPFPEMPGHTYRCHTSGSESSASALASSTAAPAQS